MYTKHGTPVISSKIIERLSYQMLFFKCRQLFIETAKIGRLFSLRNKNKNKSRNLNLKSGHAGDHSDRFNSADVDPQEAAVNFA